MTLFSNLHASSAWFAAGAWIVGATFLWAGILKAIDPPVFQRHLYNLGWVKAQFTRHVAIVIAGLEAGWGSALILGVAPGLVLPATALLLVVLTAVSWWGVQSGRTTDCGCYGGYVVPSVTQSLLLNGAFVVATMAAWLVRDAGPTPLWKIAVAGFTGAIVAGLATASVSFLRQHGRAMIDLNPLKVGARWRSRWGAVIPDDGEERIVSYLGVDCPHCKRWVRVLNVIDQSAGLPTVVGIVGTSHTKLDTFVEESGIRFPMRTIPETLMSRLGSRVPTTVLISNGMIQSKWVGQISPEFFERFRDAFFPAAERAPAVELRTART